MNEGRHKTKALPVEVLQKIFGYLDSYKHKFASFIFDLPPSGLSKSRKWLQDNIFAIVFLG
jgi:hypothetical protein